MHAATRHGIPHRRLIGALIACLLTVVVLGEIGPACMLAAQHVRLLQA